MQMTKEARALASMKPPKSVDILNPTKPKTWYFFDELGKMKMVHIDKYTLATKLQVPLRDMRVLDPLFPTPYPSSIFIRDQSIILNLEHIKLIVCADQIWLLDPSHSATFSDDDSLDSVERLKKVLSVILRVKEDVHYVSCQTSFHDMQEDILNKWTEKISREEQIRQDENEIRSHLLSTDLKLPYELRAVEAALHEFTRFLDDELQHLEADSGTALETLSQRVSRHSLENVRGIKSSLNGLYVRVGKAREQLERILDDDEDMFYIYLGDTWTDFPNMAGNSPRLQFSAPPSAIPRHSVDSININSPRFDPATPSERGGTKRRDRRTRRNNKRQYTSYNKGSVPFYEVWQEKEIDEVEAVEAFLEVYFMKTDFLMKRLNVLREKIDDTEDLINIDLDFRRNELFKVDILLTSGTMATGLVAAIAGIFGMNLQSGGEPEVDQSSHNYFVLVSVIACVGCIFVFIGLVCYLKYKRLMFVPEPKVVSSAIDRHRRLTNIESMKRIPSSTGRDFAFATSIALKSTKSPLPSTRTFTSRKSPLTNTRTREH